MRDKCRHPHQETALRECHHRHSEGRSKECRVGDHPADAASLGRFLERVELPARWVRQQEHQCSQNKARKTGEKKWHTPPVMSTKIPAKRIAQRKADWNREIEEAKHSAAH